MDEVLELLAVQESFTREDFYNAYSLKVGGTSEDAIAYALRRYLSDNRIIRVAWNKYALPGEKRIYRHSYSAEAMNLVTVLEGRYPDLLFQVFEMTQLNSFVNHLIAHNTIFLSVEGELIDFVFDSLKEDYPGLVMLKPRIEDYYRYVRDDEIVILRLPSGTPKGLNEHWQSRLEKILVDIAIDKLISKIVPSSELHNIFEGAYERYLISMDVMMQYARRKGAEKKLEGFLAEYLPQLMGDKA